MDGLDCGVPVDRRRLLAGMSGAAAAFAGCAGGTFGDGGGDTPTVDCADELPPPVRGDPDADVTVAAYEDYACPHCRTFVLDHLPDVLAEYADPGQIRYEHHDFPIPVDDTVSWRAPSAARAVQEAAGDDAFFAYSTLLYENQSDLGLDTYASLAGEVEADGDRVRAAASARCYDPVVEADRQAGDERGVEGTPTVFVDGTDVAPGEFPTADRISAAIEDALGGSG